jgi:hypothetical protein
VVVHFDEGKSTVRLEARLGNVTKVLEEGYKVRLRRVGRQVANVAGRLPLGSLSNNHIITLNTMGGEVVVTKRSRGSHAHGGHGLLLRDGRLTLLVSPVAADGSRAKPLSIHGAERALSIGAIAEGNETVSTRPAGLHIPHDTGFRHGTKGGEGLQQNLVVDLVGQVTDEDVEVVRGVLLGGVVGLVGPVDADFLAESVAGELQRRYVLTLLWMRRPFKVCMPRSAAPGSSYSTKP